MENGRFIQEPQLRKLLGFIKLGWISLKKNDVTIMNEIQVIELLDLID